MPKKVQREAKGSQREGRAKSLFYLASTLKKVTCKKMPKGAKGSQKGGQREPRGTQNSSENDKKSKLYLESGLGCSQSATSKVISSILGSFWVPFWEPKSSLLKSISIS